MPCRDWTVEDDTRAESAKEKAMLRASLCAVLTALDDQSALFEQVLSWIDWKEAGVTKKELLTWWKEHKEEDRIRRERMAEQIREIKIRKEALAKLTDEEKKILGVK